MTTCAVILHYANDFHKVMDAACKCGVDRIILWDNSRINVGVGAGYANGIKRALEKTDCEFIWLLDDDNIPEKDALKLLKEKWATKKNRYAVLSCHRRGTFYANLIDEIIGSPNAVLGLNLFCYRETRNNLKITLNNVAHLFKWCLVPVAMFGGLFFHRSLIDKIGLPDPKFTMYAGDYEWTSRMGAIHIYRDAKINEPDSSQDIYEATKGHVMFQRKFVTNRFKFFVNFLAYWLYLLYKGEDEKRRGLIAGYLEK